MKRIILVLISVIFTTGYYESIREYGPFKYEKISFATQQEEPEKYTKSINERPSNAKIERIGEKKQDGVRKLKGRN
ncbi:hypothetical protein [Aggregatibacter kilianii]|jgi:hypothetical protein|uniref:hypothetical protein n=1 Tax=Aggregatibacter kilianii TaxID=2025884 RepID=UPI00205B98D6|nr:hypothetical protein [Aggregatibacter kilianii]DAI54594.1 MAG TPA: Prokaryotic membrane lipoprotein lipid attachment site [Inoviridae sp.]